MKPECLPFEKIPHTSRLFLDFLHHFDRLQPYYGAPPFAMDAIADYGRKLEFDPARREAVAGALRAQNQSWGAAAPALANIERLRQGAVAVVSGQQVALFGGPMFSVLKALHAIMLAEELTRQGVEAVPIFWMATEDHDFPEIDHIDIPSPEWKLAHYQIQHGGAEGVPVGGIRLEADVAEAVARFAQEFPGEMAGLVREAYRPGRTLSEGFARLIASLFSQRGLILLDPMDAELHRIAAPLLLVAADRCSELTADLIARGDELERAGYHAQVLVTHSSTLLFSTEHGARIPVQRRNNGDKGFSLGAERIPEVELKARIEHTPGHFSPNALFRPVVQDYLLPTAAYIGGAAEVAYFAQSEVVYRKLLGRVTPILPRFSASLIEPRVANWLDRYRLKLQDLLVPLADLKMLIARRSFPQSLHYQFDVARQQLETSLQAIRGSLGELDPTLLGAEHTATSKMRYQLDRLEARAALTELRRNRELNQQAEALHNMLFPHDGLQERTIGWVYFLARYGNGLLDELSGVIKLQCIEHHVVRL